MDQIERISAGRFKQLSRSLNRPISPVSYDISTKKLYFRPEIDIRGKRGEEAVSLVTEFIDEAIMVQARELRILHGKGNGILKEMIRQYLNTVDVVEWFGDEHLEAGGAGITLVKLEL
jgi:DNA mismatch repair protein MutS2